jgi:PAS domain S-box-containing protein
VRIVRFAGVAAVVLLAEFCVVGIQASEPERSLLPTVVVLSSFTSTSSSSAVTETGLQRAIERAYGHPVDLQVEHLNFARPSALYQQRVADLLQAKYADQRVDVVVAVRYEALGFLLKQRGRLFAGVPIVACQIDPATFEAFHPPPDVTATLLKLDDHRTASAAIDLQPEARRVVLVGGSSGADAENQASMRRLVEARAPGIEIVTLAGTPFPELRERLSSLTRDSVVIFTGYRTDAQGRPVNPDNVVRLAAEASSAPVYGTLEVWLGLGIVGGDLIDSALIGERAGLLAARILGGTPVSSLPPVAERASRLRFDWRALRRFGLDESRLPAGSEVLFREQTLWSEHRGKILAGLALLAGQTVLISALLVARRSRKRAELGIREAERRYRTLADFTHDWEYWRRLDGSFEYVTPSCLRITGHTAEEFYDRPTLLDELMLQEDRSGWQAHDEQSRVAEGPLHAEFRIRAADGRVLWIDHVCSPVKGEDGRLLGVRGSNRDITERKQQEAELRRALAEIERLRERLEADNTYLREQVEPQESSLGMIGSSNVLQYVVAKIRQVAPTSSSVLLQGETGVGKELVAHALHAQSPRASRPLIKLNCAALPPSLVESELFGHEKGAFTGAVARRKGRFEIADGSTLFLDEIGELPLELQPKLLRVIQDGEFERVGGSETLKVDVRLIAATNRRLDEEVKAGRFREDLWYRLNVFPITVPPLRQRIEDVPQLVRHFVEKHCRRLGKKPLEISEGTLRDLQAHDWPGNVRELEAVVERAVISSTGPALRIGAELQPGGPVAPPTATASVPPKGAELTAPSGARTLLDLERDHIVATLERTYWRLSGASGAAVLLGMNPSTLRSRMRKLGITRPQPRPERPAKPVAGP